MHNDMKMFLNCIFISVFLLHSCSYDGDCRLNKQGIMLLSLTVLHQGKKRCVPELWQISLQDFDPIFFASAFKGLFSQWLVAASIKRKCNFCSEPHHVIERCSDWYEKTTFSKSKRFLTKQEKMMSTISSINSTVSIFLSDNIVPKEGILQRYNIENTRRELSKIIKQEILFGYRAYENVSWY